MDWKYLPYKSTIIVIFVTAIYTFQNFAKGKQESSPFPAKFSCIAQTTAAIESLWTGICRISKIYVSMILYFWGKCVRMFAFLQSIAHNSMLHCLDHRILTWTFILHENFTPQLNDRKSLNFQICFEIEMPLFNVFFSHFIVR